MKLLAIDPGNEKSAWMMFDVDGGCPGTFGIDPNEAVLDIVQSSDVADHLVIEMVASYGMAVGREVFETVFWIGRFFEAFPGERSRLYRRDVKMHLCGNNTAKDANIRQALIDRYGPSKPLAIGTKKSPGPLYGVHKDVWAALAVAVTWADRNRRVVPTLEQSIAANQERLKK